MKITSLTSATCKLIETEMAEALREVAERHGLKVAPAGGSFNEGEFTAKVKWTVADPVASADLERRLFEEICVVFGVAPDAYGKTLVSKGVVYTLIGFDTRRSKFCVRTRAQNGKIMFFGEEILRHFKMAEAKQ
jgi:hypothetical protein